MSLFHPTRRLALRRIVLPTDFSVCAERALPRALALAEQFGAEIHLVHVLPSPGEEEGDQEAHAWREESARARLEATRMAYRYGLPGAHSAPMELIVVRNGHPASAVAAYARDHEADLIVMGTHGWSFRREAAMGSITAALLREAPCPVMTVSAFRKATGMIRRIAAVLDDSDAAANVLHYAGNMAHMFDAKLTLLQTASATSGHTVRHRVDGELAPLLQQAGLPDTLELHTAPAPLEASVPRITAQLDADLIVLPARLQRAEPPDLAYEIVRAVSCSVLAVESNPVGESTVPESHQRPHVVPLSAPPQSAAKS